MCTDEVRRAVVLLLAFTSCLNPDDILPVRGHVEAADQLVVFSRAPTLSPTSCGEWKELERAFTDSDGGYAFEVFRAQTIKFTTGQTSCFRVDTNFVSGAHVSATMFALASEAQVPLLADWDPIPYSDGERINFEPYRQPTDAGVFMIRHVMSLHDGVRQVWRATDAQWTERGFVKVPMDLDARIFQQFDAFVEMSATYVQSDALENPLEELVVLPRVEVEFPYRWHFGVERIRPASSGAPCDFMRLCALTDGQLHTESLRQMPWMQINFPEPVKPELVVVRALVVHGNIVKISGVLADQKVVELATYRLSRELDDAPRPLRDGGSEPGPNFFSVRLDAGVEFRALRLEAEGLVSAQEVSVF